jgi:hypothetical protein
LANELTMVEEQRSLVMAERLVREGRSEAEIVTALEEAAAGPDEAVSAASPRTPLRQRVARRRRRSRRPERRPSESMQAGPDSSAEARRLIDRGYWL